jgi:hypothetical protein
MTIGGANYDEACGGDPLDATDSVQYGVATASPYVWNNAASLPERRATGNAVILPDESVLYVGGRNAAAHTKRALLFVGQIESGSWQPMALEDSRRSYHSTAQLLPDGRVLSGGSNERDWDYQVFTPRYHPSLSGKVAPNITSAPTVMNYFESGPTQYQITFTQLPAGVSVQKVVLVRPGSVTHHSDFDQRLLRLQITAQSFNSVRFYAPQNSKHAPRGYYMLFAVTNEGTPSAAKFVKLE